ncbi:MAG: PIN domain-containing protein [Pyrinomonadaceae bacterium]|nr:PIN domain-containing protein [Pyrinomonadaceae bacterium]
MAVVLDTDIVSCLYKEDSRAELYRPHLSSLPYVISFMTLAELRHWALGRNWGVKRLAQLEEYLSTFLIVFADDDLCRIWAEAMNSARKNGKPISAADAWVASTALILNVPLISHNRKHFVGVDGLTIISETD